MPTNPAGDHRVTQGAGMIPNLWYAIPESGEVKNGKPIGVTRMGEKLAAWRDARGGVTVMSDKCPHRGVQLSLGALKGDGIQCPFHGFEFDTSGACTLVTANGRNAEPPRAIKAHTYPTREAHGFIDLRWSEPRESDPELPFFESIGEKLIPGDGPIITYRKIRRRLIEEAESEKTLPRQDKFRP
jgi:phenylpropionate dioxygenase-like ring-hydroxylating dioxygenase large terminal subunit